jgi:hypothetical protein
VKLKLLTAEVSFSTYMASAVIGMVDMRNALRDWPDDAPEASLAPQT